MRQPIQVWAPLFYRSPFSDFSLDLQRAHKEWIDEDRIWLLPGAKEITRFIQRGKYFNSYECIIPSSELNVIYIYNIDEKGNIYSPIQNLGRWKNKIPKSAYIEWIKNTPEIIYFKEYTYINMLLPVVSGSEITFSRQKLKIEPGPIFPIGLNEENGLIEGRWPPPGSAPTISPDVESTKYNQGKEKKGILNMKLEWQEPFNIFFPDGGGIEVWYHQTILRNYIKDLNNSYKKVLQNTKNWVGKFISESQSTIEKSWFLPKLLNITNVNGILFDIEGKFNIDLGEIINPFESEEFKKLLLDKIPVQRIYSWVGYFWWEFYQDILSNINIRFCKNCGSIITGGRKDRIYCSNRENEECYKKRLADRRRKSYYKKIG